MKRLETLFNDIRGVAAVEFALIAPVMAALLLGTIELYEVTEVKRRVASTASSVADLAARPKALDNTDVRNIFSVAKNIFSPYNDAAIKITLTSVRINLDGTSEVDWSEGYNTAPLSADRPFTLPNGLGVPGGSVIVANVQYEHSSALGRLFPSAVSHQDVFYTKPRQTLRVQRF